MNPLIFFGTLFLGVLIWYIKYLKMLIGQLTDIFSGLLTLATVICVDKYGIGHRAVRPGRTSVEALNNSMNHVVHNEQNFFVNFSILGSHWG